MIWIKIMKKFLRFTRERERVKTPLKTVGGSGVAFLLPLLLVIAGFLFFPNITFSGTSGTTNVTTAGKTVGDFTLSGAGGTWQLQDALTSSGDLILSAGTFDSNSQTIIMSTLSVSSGNTRTLTLGSSAITITGVGSGNNFYALNRTGLTVTANTAVVTITGGNAA